MVKLYLLKYMKHFLQLYYMIGLLNDNPYTLFPVHSLSQYDSIESKEA
jgi:hypothetical protein